MRKEEALKIAKRFPEAINAFPRSNFEEQLANFILKEKLEETK